MKVKFELTENVAMTTEGLMKFCPVCEKYKPLKKFPFSKMHAYKRDEVCLSCLEKKK